MKKRKAGRRGAAQPALSRRGFLGAAGAAVGGVMIGGVAGFEYTMARLNRIGRFDADALAELRAGRTTHLFERYPALRDALPWRPLGRWPTPVEPLPPVESAEDVQLWVKRDDRASDRYGGNKVRKLETLLAEAALAGRRTLLTLGGIGTNQGVATAVHGRALGFDTHVVLFDQPISDQVQRNVRAMLAAGARLEYAGGTARALLRSRRRYDALDAGGHAPYFLLAGGSTALGAIGHIDAALELADQVSAGAMPEPDRLFVPLGTCGTAAGLALGCRLAGLRTRVTPVRVVDFFPANAYVTRKLANDAARWLGDVDPGFPSTRVAFADLDIVGDQFGGGYALPTGAALAAAAWAAPHLALDTTYSAKAFAGCLAYCRERARPGEVVLFWNTFSSAPLVEAESLDGLPHALAHVFGGRSS